MLSLERNPKSTDAYSQAILGVAEKVQTVLVVIVVGLESSALMEENAES